MIHLFHHPLSHSGHLVSLDDQQHGIEIEALTWCCLPALGVRGLVSLNVQTPVCHHS